MSEEKKTKKHNFFIEGPIKPAFIGDSIQKHSTKHSIGAHSIFLGQVRADVKDDKKVVGIEYLNYQSMAEAELLRIREEAFNKYSLTCLHIYHSIGLVPTGEISLFVFVSSPHRKESFKAVEGIVEDIKAHVPVWGKEILEDGSFFWKENKG